MDPTVLFYLWVLMVGMIVGSFLNVVGLRLLREESFVLPPSHCYACDAKIKPYDNIPVISWLMLRGKCRACKATISWQYPAIELATGLIFVALVHQFGLTWQTACLAFLSANFMVILITDFREQYIFDINSLGLIPVGLTYSILNLGALPNPSVTFNPLPWLSMPAVLWDALLGMLVAFAIFKALNLYSRFLAGQDGFGEGDSRMMMGVGSFFGAKFVVMTFLLGFVVQALIGIPMMLIQWVRYKALRALTWMVGAAMMALLPYGIQQWLGTMAMATVWVALGCGIIAIWASMQALKSARQLDIPLTTIPFGPALVFGAWAMLFFQNSINEIISRWLLRV